MIDNNILFYIGNILIFSFVLALSIIFNKEASRKVEKDKYLDNKSPERYRAIWYKILTKYFIVGSIFAISVGIIGIIKTLFFS